MTDESNGFGDEGTVLPPKKPKVVWWLLVGLLVAFVIIVWVVSALI